MNPYETKPVHAMTSELSPEDFATAKLIENAVNGDKNAAAKLFEIYRRRLRRVLQLRLDDRLKGRLDPSDLLQEVYIEFAKSIAQYRIEQGGSLFVWLRHLAQRRLQMVHRMHLNSQKRNACLEVSYGANSFAQSSAVQLVNGLLSENSTPSNKVLRREVQSRVQEVLLSLAPLDRAILDLRHFEQLSNKEAAEVLGVTEAVASVRFIRALRRLKKLLVAIPGIGDSGSWQT